MINLKDCLFQVVHSIGDEIISSIYIGDFVIFDEQKFALIGKDISNPDEIISIRKIDKIIKLLSKSDYENYKTGCIDLPGLHDLANESAFRINISLKIINNFKHIMESLK